MVVFEHAFCLGGGERRLEGLYILVVVLGLTQTITKIKCLGVREEGRKKEREGGRGGEGSVVKCEAKHRLVVLCQNMQTPSHYSYLMHKTNTALIFPRYNEG